MTGKSILEALSYVDEQYIEEAESGTMPDRIPMKRLLPLAACLGVALLGLRFMDFSDTSESISVGDALRAEQEIALETYSKTENSLNDECEILMDSEADFVVGEVPSVILRIHSWEENSFTATVEEIVDTDAIPIGQTVRVELLPELCTDAKSDNSAENVRGMSVREEFPEGALVQVRCVVIDADTGVIVAEAISQAD